MHRYLSLWGDVILLSEMIICTANKKKVDRFSKYSIFFQFCFATTIVYALLVRIKKKIYVQVLSVIFILLCWQIPVSIEVINQMTAALYQKAMSISRLQTAMLPKAMPDYMEGKLKTIIEQDAVSGDIFLIIEYEVRLRDQNYKLLWMQWCCTSYATSVLCFDCHVLTWRLSGTMPITLLQHLHTF